jgi:hypothetical protein
MKIHKEWFVGFASVVAFLAAAQAAAAAGTEEELNNSVAVAQSEATSDAKALEGLWSGSWGHNVDADGTVYQPVKAELLIQRDRVEWHGFPGVRELTGTVRFDPSTHQMHVTPAAKANGGPAETIVLKYGIKADELSLTDRDDFSFTLHREPVVQDPLANVKIEFVAATGINDAGDLLVTEFNVLRAGRSGAIYYEPVNWSLKTKQATVWLVQEDRCKRLALAEARRQIRQPTLVAVAYRVEDRHQRQRLHRLWKEVGSPNPESEAGLRTFAQVLQPGTVVFVLSARENAAQP